MDPQPVVARCGRSDDHAAHVFLETHGWRNGRKTWCAGNRDIVRALEVDAESLANAAEMGVYSEINPASDEEIE